MEFVEESGKFYKKIEIPLEKLDKMIARTEKQIADLQAKLTGLKALKK